MFVSSTPQSFPDFNFSEVIMVFFFSRFVEFLVGSDRNWANGSRTT